MSSIIYKIYRDPEEDKREIQKVDRWIFYFLLGVIGLVPLLVGGHMTEVISPRISSIPSLSTAYKGDLFTFYKFAFLIVFTALALGFFLYKLFVLDYRFPRKAPLLIFGMMLLALILSAVLAPYKTIALFGQYNRTDGTLSYICYFTLMFIAMHIEYPKKVVQVILFCLYPFVLINIVLMTMNFTGHDAMMYDPVQKWMSLTLPEGANLGEGSVLLGTLNQWNYMSGMFAVMTVLFLAAAMAEEKMLIKSLHFIMALFSISTMLMSISTSGFLTICLLSMFLLLFAWKLSNRKKALITFAAFYILCVPIMHVLSEQNPRVWTESIGFVTSINPYMPEVSAKLSSIAYAADTEFQLPELPESSMSSGSGRSYIWVKTLELIKDRPFVGYGLDTLMYHFPHNNIEARSGLGIETVVVDKSHSMYIGMLYGTGIIGLASFLILIVYMSWKCLLPFIRQNSQLSLKHIFGLAWLAFLIQALFNDSLPGTAAPMFTMGGVALALIYKEKAREK